jgi:hypothetical protein
MAATLGSVVRRASPFITLRKNSVTCFSMGATACSNDNLPMSECKQGRSKLWLAQLELGS